MKKELLNLVRKNGLALKDIKEQTEEICPAAVKKHGLALQFVKEEFKHLFN